MSENEKLHREMWHWIAEETRKQKRFVTKQEWPKIKNYSTLFYCFACEEAFVRFIESKYSCDNRCAYCPLVWGTESESYTGEPYCQKTGALYKQWIEQGIRANWQEAADLANQIAEMEWR